jgi:hypothetical protein
MTRHATISYAKSILRLAGCFLLFPYHPLFSTLFFVAEVLGIIEEVGQ